MKFILSLANKIKSFFKAAPNPEKKKRKTILDFRSSTQQNFRKAVSKYLIEVHHTNSELKEYLWIVDPNQLKEFVGFILRSHLPVHYKLILTLQVGAGGRINEILNLKREDILLDEGLIRITVLKKRTKKLHRRHAQIAEDVLPLLRKYLIHLEGDKLFDINRHSVYKFYMKMMGICTHSLRHTFVSYLVQVLKWTPEQVQKFMLFEDIKDALVYYNTNTKAQAKTINL